MIRLSLWERWERYVDRSGGPNACWPWIGSIRNGYGQMRIGSQTDGTRRMEGSHRVAYMLHVGALVDGLVVMHACDNRRCCNPAHLRQDTQSENVRDCVAKGRYVVGDRSNCGRPCSGALNPSARLTPAQVLSLRVRALTGDSLEDLAREYAINRWHAHAIVRGKSWSTGPFPDVRPTS